MFIRMVILAAAVALAGVAGPGGRAEAASAKAQATVTPYPLPAIYKTSTAYALKANGTNVPVIEFAGAYDYAVFSAEGRCALEVTRLDGKAIEQHGISPMKLQIDGAVRENKLTFSVEKPAYLIVSVDELKKLVIAIDPIEMNKPPSSGAGIFNVTAAPYGADRSGSLDSTDAIQRAVNDAAAAKSGRGASDSALVYVPNGTYHLRELRLPSNVTLYLDSGAVLQMAGKREDFQLRYRKNSQNRHGTWFIYTADGATNVKILGRGTIDGHGKHHEKANNLTSHIVVPMNCTGFTLDGPVLRESGLWGVVIANSRGVALRNTKHFNHHDQGENDCVDVCNSQDVTISRSIGISLDDPYSTKCWGEEVDISRQWTGEFLPNRNILIEDCLSWTRCFAFKVGAGVWHDQENITIRDCVAYDSAHAFGISHSYGSRDVRNVVVENMDVERNTMTNLGRSWARIVIEKRKPDGGLGGSIHDITLRNINVRDAGTDAVPIEGLAADKHISGVTFQNIRMPGQSAAAQSLAEIGVKETRFAQGVGLKKESSAKGQAVEGRPVRESVSGREGEPQG